MATVALLFAAVALLTGAVGGALHGLKYQCIGAWMCFLVHLGLMGVVSPTFAQTMEILPLALLYAAAAGVVPFMLAYAGLRAVVAKRVRA